LFDIGINAYQNGQFTEAREAFVELQLALHRNEGVWTLSQIDILDYLAAMASIEGDRESADRMQNLKLRVVEHNYPANHPLTVSATLDFAEYQQRMGRYEVARDILEETIEHQMETGYNPAHIRLLKNQYIRGVCCKKSTLEQAHLTLSEAHELDSTDRAKHLLDLGDLTVMSGSPLTSADYYRGAVRILPGLRTHMETPALIGISRSDRMARAYLDVTREHRRLDSRYSLESANPSGAIVGSPLPVCESGVQDLLGSEDYASMEVKLALTVSPEGKAKDITVVESNAPVRLTRLVKRLYEITRFRPALVDDVASSEQIEITQSFEPLTNPSGGLPLAHVATVHTCSELAGFYDWQDMNGLANIR
jgi:hypothetical protein